MVSRNEAQRLGYDFGVEKSAGFVKSRNQPKLS